MTALGDEQWADVEAVVYFWVRTSRMQQGLDERLLAALRAWFRDEWKTEPTVFVTNEQFTQQLGVFERSDLHRRFELIEPGKPGTYLAFG